MDKIWYDELTNKIINSFDKVIFVKDTNNLFERNDLRLYFENQQIEIYYFSNDLILRKKIISQSKLIVITKNERNLPYDLFNKFPMIEISLKDIFPTLDNHAFKDINIEKIDILYSDYIRTNNKYIKKTYSESNNYIKSISSQLIEENSPSQSLIKLEKLIEDLKRLNTIEDSNLKYFHKVSKIVGEIYYLSSVENYKLEIENICMSIDYKFKEYIDSNFNNLGYIHNFDLSPLNSNILDSINFDKNIAVICLDCMSFAEWYTLKYYLKDFGINDFEESFSLSLIPSITKYSRLAIFEGKTPLNSESKNEEKAFKNYLKEKNKNLYDVFFKNLRESHVNLEGYKYVGLIYTFIDDIVHGAINKKMTILSTIESLKEMKFENLILNLLENKFDIYLTSDHGNVQCKSNGINIPKQMVDEKDTRVVIYNKKNLSEEIQWDSKVCLNFPTIMGNDKYIVTDKKRKNFGNRTEGLSHGGISFEEVMVPFIKIGGKK